jgi:hypothetical protein
MRPAWPATSEVADADVAEDRRTPASSVRRGRTRAVATSAAVPSPRARCLGVAGEGRSEEKGEHDEANAGEQTHGAREIGG